MRGVMASERCVDRHSDPSHPSCVGPCGQEGVVPLGKMLVCLLMTWQRQITASTRLSFENAGVGDVPSFL